MKYQMPVEAIIQTIADYADLHDMTYDEAESFLKPIFSNPEWVSYKGL